MTIIDTGSFEGPRQIRSIADSVDEGLIGRQMAIDFLISLNDRIVDLANREAGNHNVYLYNIAVTLERLGYMTEEQRSVRKRIIEEDAEQRARRNDTYIN